MQDRNYAITWLVRRLFRALAERSNQLLAETGISAADRAVLEFLYPDLALSVPELAARYDVSRQHVQVTVNRLAEQGLVRTRPNPRHRRSHLVTLTRAGRVLFAGILDQDRAAVERLFADIPERQLAATKKTLETVYERLKEGESP